MTELTTYASTDEKYVVVIGGMNMDICGRPADSVVDRDSNPGIVSLSVGGVGQNIAQNLAKLGVPTHLITVYGDDDNGRAMQSACAANGINLDHAARLEGRRSSTYLFVTDETGDMLVAVNDMDICKEISPEFLAERLDFINGAAICLLDANLSPETMAWIGEHVTAPLFGDTVSVAKAHHFDALLDKMTVLKPNDLEASLLSGIDIVDDDTAREAATVLLGKGMRTVFISRGAHGILCASNGEDGVSMVKVAPYPTNIATANGAGDSGMAAITWSYFDDPTRDLAEVGRIAQAASSIALECTESVPNLSVERIRAKMASR